jgi:hypothetical protein
MGRGPVCGMMTRRTGGPEGTGDSATVSTGSTEAGAGGAGAGAGGRVGLSSGTATAGAILAVGSSTGGAGGGTGLATGGGVATTGAAAAAGPALTGGRAMTGPTGGLLAIAGADGGTTIGAWGRGCGTTRRGWTGTAAGDGVAVAAGGDAVATLGCAALTAAGDATTAAGRGGAALAAASACLRSRIALRASPGLETLERSNFGLVSPAGLAEALLLPPFLKYSRTFSAWSASMELEWVFPVTPIASSASRIGLLLTSSSRARSLIRTLLIRPFSVPFALSCSYQPHRRVNSYCKCYLRRRRVRGPENAVVRGLSG